MEQFPTYDEKAILEEVANGSEAALRSLFDRYRQKIYSMAMYLTRSEVIAEEILQDVFVKVWQKREQMRDIEYFNAWIRTVARNAAFSHLRSMAAEKLALQRFAERSHRSEVIQDDIADREYERILKHAISLLSQQQRKVYLLSRQEGLKYEEIAKYLNISVFTVKEHMRIALRSIRTYLDEKIGVVVLIAISLYLD